MIGSARTGILVAALSLGLLGGCSAIYRNHGYVPTEDELSEVTVGVDTRASVEETLGAASVGGLLEGGDLYYVQSRVRHFGMKRPEEVERQVVAISFDQSGVVKNIERFGLEDGQVVALERRVTSSSVEGKGFLRQLLGNIGKFNAGQLLPSGG